MSEKPTKRCPRCGETKPRAELAKASKDGLYSYCRPCRRAYNEDWYDKQALEAREAEFEFAFRFDP